MADIFRDNIPEAEVGGSGIDADDTALTVVSGTGWPSLASDQTILACLDWDTVDAEWVRLSDTTGTAWVITERGLYGTAESTHAAGVKIRHGGPAELIQLMARSMVYPPRIVGYRYAACFQEGWGTAVNPIEQLQLQPIWIADEDDQIGVEVTSAGTPGAGAEAHILLFDFSGNMLHDITSAALTSTGDRWATLPAIQPGWFLASLWLKSTWTTAPTMRTIQGPFGSPIASWVGRHMFEFHTVTSVPSSVNLASPGNTPGAGAAIFTRRSV